MSPDRLEIEVSRPHGAIHAGAPQPDGAPTVLGQQDASAAQDSVVDLAEVDDGHRRVSVRALGPRWADVDLSPLAADTPHQSGAPL